MTCNITREIFLKLVEIHSNYLYIKEDKLSYCLECNCEFSQHKSEKDNVQLITTAGMKINHIILFCCS